VIDGKAIGGKVFSPTDKSIAFSADGKHSVYASCGFYNQCELVRDGATAVKSEEFRDADGKDGKSVLDLEWSDPSPIRDGKAHSYHLKLVQDDLNLVWSSPIWWTLP